MTPLPDRRKVVVTGIGAVTPLGIGATTLHDRWAEGVVGIEDGAGRSSEFEPKDHLSVKEARRLDRFSQFAVVAAGEALAQAGWDGEPPYDPLSVGCVIATGIGGQATVEAQLDVMRGKGAKAVSPLGIPQYMPNAAAGALGMYWGTPSGETIFAPRSRITSCWISTVSMPPIPVPITQPIRIGSYGSSSPHPASDTASADATSASCETRSSRRASLTDRNSVGS